MTVYSKARDFSNIFGYGNASISKNFGESQKRVRTLYRSCLRRVPEIIALYQIGYPIKDVKFAIRHAFEKNRGITDQGRVDFLCFVGENELLETIKIWKQKGHLSKYLEPLRTPKQTTLRLKDILARAEQKEKISAFPESQFHVEGMSSATMPRRY